MNVFKVLFDLLLFLLLFRLLDWLGLVRICCLEGLLEVLENVDGLLCLIDLGLLNLIVVIIEGIKYPKSSQNSWLLLDNLLLLLHRLWEHYLPFGF